VKDKIHRKDQRKPPPIDLLVKLGPAYSSWETKVYAGGRIKILEYDFIESDGLPPSKEAWIMVLKQIEVVHSLGYVHGDLLPRNLIFSGESGYVIDFDLMRKEDVKDVEYVSGYNSDFPPYRHPHTRAGEKMKKEHDVWALARMTASFFGIEAAGNVSITELQSLVNENDQRATPE
jgi:serine/threonine protein kinase